MYFPEPFPDAVYKEIVLYQGNDHCCDCDSLDTSWASVSHGTLICLECAGKHRSLGVHVSFVRSIKMDSWSKQQVEMMRQGGNEQIKRFFRKLDIEYSPIQTLYCTKGANHYRERLKERVDRIIRGDLIPEKRSISKDKVSFDHSMLNIPAQSINLKDDRTAKDPKSKFHYFVVIFGDGAMGMTLTKDHREMALVSKLLPDGAAQLNGVKIGDYVIGVAGKSLEKYDEIMHMIPCMVRPLKIKFSRYIGKHQNSERLISNNTTINQTSISDTKLSKFSIHISKSETFVNPFQDGHHDLTKSTSFIDVNPSKLQAKICPANNVNNQLLIQIHHRKHHGYGDDDDDGSEDSVSLASIDSPTITPQHRNGVIHKMESNKQNHLSTLLNNVTVQDDLMVEDVDKVTPPPAELEVNIPVEKDETKSSSPKILKNDPKHVEEIIEDTDQLAIISNQIENKVYTDEDSNAELVKHLSETDLVITEQLTLSGTRSHSDEFDNKSRSPSHDQDPNIEIYPNVNLILETGHQVKVHRHGKWRSATIKRRHKNGTYKVIYEQDLSTESHVPINRMAISYLLLKNSSESNVLNMNHYSSPETSKKISIPSNEIIIERNDHPTDPEMDQQICTSPPTEEETKIIDEAVKFAFQVETADDITNDHIKQNIDNVPSMNFVIEDEFDYAHDFIVENHDVDHDYPIS